MRNFLTALAKQKFRRRYLRDQNQAGGSLYLLLIQPMYIDDDWISLVLRIRLLRGKVIVMVDK
jgi:hypothetical protein